MKLRKIHKIVGLVFAPFFALTALTAIPLFWRKENLYSDDTKDLLLGLHNWEIASKYIGTILALALLFMTVTGVTIAIKSARDRNRQQ